MKINFEVSAKAARLIGRENIADVDGALIELIKNAYDADASCVYVEFYIPFPDVPTKISVFEFSSVLTEKDFKTVLSYYHQEDELLQRNEDLTDFDKDKLRNILFSYDRILIADNGEGMGMDTIHSAWMQIGTSSKEVKIMSKKGRIKTGAKGIGRFALDKLSQKSIMYTKSAGATMLRWQVDWEQFSSAQLLRDVNAEIDAQRGTLLDILRPYMEIKDYEKISEYCWDTGTAFILSPTREAWSSRLFSKVNTNLKSINPLGSVDQFDVIVNNRLFPQYSYHTERVAIAETDYDYKIQISYDGDDTLLVDVNRNEFDAKAVTARFSVGSHAQNFSLNDFWCRKAFLHAPFRKEDYCSGKHTFILSVKQFIRAQDFDKVHAVGSFTADLFFIKNGKSHFPFVKDVPTRKRKELLQKFSGVKLYRDNFKVRPYGDEGSLYDWIELNDRANRSPASVSHLTGAWRVLPYQMIGVVKIGRLQNVGLHDMANREGLAQNESYFHFVRMLQEAISCFELDRQYIYREYDRWETECKRVIASFVDRVKDDIRKSGSYSENNGTDQEGYRENDGAERTTGRFTEEEYRETIDTLLRESDHEVKAKQTIEILSSAGVILNTFFHEFRGLSTALHTRGSQMRGRLDYILRGRPYEGPAFLDPYRKLDNFDEIDQMLSSWLKVVMDALQDRGFRSDVLPLREETIKITTIWMQLLKDKNIEVTVLPEKTTDDSFFLKFAVVDLYIIINNFILNSVYFFESSEQDSRRIIFTFSETETSIIMTLKNNGPVLDKKYQNHPMQIFEIGESSKKDGTGLGLWLMRDAAERNNGQIRVLDIQDAFGIEIEFKK